VIATLFWQTSTPNSSKPTVWDGDDSLLLKSATPVNWTSSKPTVWDGDENLALQTITVSPKRCSKPTVWDGDENRFYGLRSYQGCSKPTVWDGDLSVLSVGILSMWQVLSPPCGMETYSIYA
jgi:hypothetical protein